tara:strand:- start:8390 stop:8527 length:138 start_codon:yes stop_codon:yes gene_type:complete
MFRNVRKNAFKIYGCQKCKVKIGLDYSIIPVFSLFNRENGGDGFA